MRAMGWLCVAAAVAFGCGKTNNGSGQTPGGGSGSGLPPAAQHALHIHVTGNGDARSSAPAFSCASDCQQMVDSAAMVHLVAVPASGWKFDGWQGGCSGAAACDVTMAADHDVTAAFSALPPPAPGNARVSVVFIGNGSGRVTSAPAGIDCPGTCSMNVQSGSLVALSGQPDANSGFTGWGGGCNGVGGCSVSASADVTVWANFTANAPPPPPPPPAQCANLTPGAPPPAMSIANYTSATCGAGMGDLTGTLGLESFDSPAGDTLHIVDSNTGMQAGVASYGGAKGFFMPTRDGFIGAFHYLTNPTPYWFAQYWRHDGAFVQSGRGIVGTSLFSGTPFGTVAIAGNFNWQGLPARPQLWMIGWNQTDVQCGHDLASAGTVFGLGGDANGRVLVIIDGGGGTISGQWFDETCTAMTGVFTLISGFSAGANTWFETAPLIGGGVAVRRVDQQNDADGRPYRTAQWLVKVQAGSATPQPAPKWLTDRPGTSMAIARSGNAYAMLPLGAPDADCAQKVEVIAPDGTACGSFDATIASGGCRTEDLALGLDGTLIQLLPKNLRGSNTCAYRWWPHALR